MTVTVDEFRVGDEVRLTKENFRSIPVGHRGVVERVRVGLSAGAWPLDVRWENEAYDGEYIGTDEVEKIEEKEVSVNEVDEENREFQVGDKVVLSKPVEESMFASSAGLSNDEVYTVASTVYDGVTLEGVQHPLGESAVWTNSRFKKFEPEATLPSIEDDEPEEEEETVPFEVGDKVRVVSGLFPSLLEGEEFTVRQVASPFIWIREEGTDPTSDGWFYDRFEKVEEQPAEDEGDDADKPIVKVGDVFTYRGGWALPESTVYRVTQIQPDSVEAVVLDESPDALTRQIGMPQWFPLDSKDYLVRGSATAEEPERDTPTLTVGARVRVTRVPGLPWIEAGWATVTEADVSTYFRATLDNGEGEWAFGPEDVAEVETPQSAAERKDHTALCDEATRVADLLDNEFMGGLASHIRALRDALIEESYR